MHLASDAEAQNPETLALENRNHMRDSRPGPALLRPGAHGTSPTPVSKYGLGYDKGRINKQIDWIDELLHRGRVECGPQDAAKALRRND